MLHGNDVSGYQPGWYPGGGDGFAAIKVTEGTTYVNPSYTTQLARARARNLPVIHYHFMSGGSPGAQADWCMRHVKLQPGDGIAVDWETPGIGWGAKTTLINDLQHAAPHTAVGLYTDGSMWSMSDHYAGDFLWYAHPGSPPAGNIPWTIWQYSWSPIDANWARFNSVAEMRAFLDKGQPTPPTPTPVPVPTSAGILGMPNHIGPL